MGALINKSFKYRARSWELTKSETVCPFCAGGCNLVLNSKDGSFMRVTTDFEAPPNYGIICSRPRFNLDILAHNERLMKPLIRKNGSFVKVSWDEGLDFAAGGLDGRLHQLAAVHHVDADHGFAVAPRH